MVVVSVFCCEKSRRVNQISFSLSGSFCQWCTGPSVSRYQEYEDTLKTNADQKLFSSFYWQHFDNIENTGCILITLLAAYLSSFICNGEFNFTSKGLNYFGLRDLIGFTINAKLQFWWGTWKWKVTKVKVKCDTSESERWQQWKWKLTKERLKPKWWNLICFIILWTYAKRVIEVS